MLAGRPQFEGKVLILVVERDPHVRELERYFLEQAGCTVEFADDGMQALERARTLVPDMMIAEILVPRMDGLSVCRALKADPATRTTRVIIFSILAAEERARQAGADAFLRKPLDSDTLIHAVEQLLPRYAQGALADGTIANRQ